jgi:hypothetical protein
VDIADDRLRDIARVEGQVGGDRRRVAVVKFVNVEPSRGCRSSVGWRKSPLPELLPASQSSICTRREASRPCCPCPVAVGFRPPLETW